MGVKRKIVNMSSMNMKFGADSGVGDGINAFMGAWLGF